MDVIPVSSFNIAVGFTLVCHQAFRAAFPHQIAMHDIDTVELVSAENDKHSRQMSGQEFGRRLEQQINAY